MNLSSKVRVGFGLKIDRKVYRQIEDRYIEYIDKQLTLVLNSFKFSNVDIDR